MTPRFLAALLSSSAFALVARAILTFIFWGAGLDKLFNFGSALELFSFFGVEPAGFFVPLAIVVLLGGSALVIANRMAWLGFGMLAVFTALTIPIAHPFWTMEGQQRLFEFHVVVEHISLIGGLMVGAILCWRLERERLGR
ncbi:DoxX family protein [Xanthobacter sp. KR7-65]|uniref:DoxX family protein n=1 Tax=Xanthobacter sp. KR7-65 TaxID=3156612 RepID=UPI0032B362E9